MFTAHPQQPDEVRAEAAATGGAAGVRRRARFGALCGAAVLVALLALALAAGASAQVSLTGPTSYGLGAGADPSSVAVGDFNGDSDPELVVANQGTDNVRVLLGQPGPEFIPMGIPDAGDGPSSVAVGDFNGDSDPDLAVANKFSNDVSVLLASGGGGTSFLPPSNVAAGNAPSAVAVGNFNGDSDPDLAVANELSHNVSVLLGGEGGSFTETSKVGVGVNPSSVAVGNFNGDNRPDLAVANRGSPSVSVLLNRGDGSFDAAFRTFPAGDSNSVAVGDFNRDGHADLAVAKQIPGIFGDVSVLLGTGNGTFGEATLYAHEDAPNSVAVADFNDDLKSDLVFTDGAAFGGDDNVSVLQNNFGGPGGVNFFKAARRRVGGAPNAVAVGDFDNDSDPDVAVTDAGSDDVSVLLNNDRPTAVADVYASDEDTELFQNPGVLFNDTDPEADSLTATLVSGPAHGSLTLSPVAGWFSYTPEPNFHGTDSFTYKASDGTFESATATVTIEVKSIADAPLAQDDTYATDEDKPLAVAPAGVLGNDTDGDGDALAAAPASDPAHGSLTLNGDGSFSYTPAPDYHGSDSFTYRASDGHLVSEPVTVTIEVGAVNDAPDANDDAYATDEDAPLTLGVLDNDTNVDGDSLSATEVSDPAHGSLALNPDGSLTYRPDPDFNGNDSFSYRASDGSLASEPATVTLRVDPVKDAPNASDDAFETDEDTPLTLHANAFLDNDTHPDGDGLSVLTVSDLDDPASGSLDLSGDGTYTYTPAPNFTGSTTFRYVVYDSSFEFGSATVTITVKAVNDAPDAKDDEYATDEDTALSVAVLGNDSDSEGDGLAATEVSDPPHGSLTDNPDGSLTYTPDPDFNGSDSFSYRATDGNLESAPTTVTIDVSAVDDTPSATEDAYTTDEDTPLTVAAPGVLDNDADPDRDGLTVTHQSGPAHGSLTLNGDGSFSYTPAPDYNGSDSFSYKASDDGQDSDPAPVTIEVRPVDDTQPDNPAQPPPAGPAQPPPAGPALPSADFTIGSFKFKSRSTVVSVVVPGPGTVTAQHAPATTARVSATAKKKTLVKRTRKVATKAGSVRLRLKPTKAGQKVLRHKKKLTARMRFTFTPSGGTAKSTFKKVTIKLKKR